MKRILLAVFVALSFPSLAFADLLDADGNEWREWQRLSGLAATLYVSGFVAGNGILMGEVQSACFASKSYPTREIMALPENERDAAMAERVRKANEFCSSIYPRHDLSGIQVGQFVSGLDRLYADFKNRRIRVVDGIFIVRQQITGVSDEDIEAILLKLRAGEGPPLLIDAKDSDGHLRFIFFP